MRREPERDETNGDSRDRGLAISLTRIQRSPRIVKFAVDEPLGGGGGSPHLLLLLDVDPITFVESIENLGDDRKRGGRRRRTQKLLANRQNRHLRISTKQQKVDEARFAFDEVNDRLQFQAEVPQASWPRYMRG